MPETKYGKYIVRGSNPNETRVSRKIAGIDDARIPGSFHFVFTWVHPWEASNKTHGPHVHPVPELLGYFGSDPNNPFDLGAELDIYMGEEMEKHTFNQSSLIYIPPNLPHAPIVIKKMERPYIFIYTMPSGKILESSRKDLVPESLKDIVMFPH